MWGKNALGGFQSAQLSRIRTEVYFWYENPTGWRSSLITYWQAHTHTSPYMHIICTTVRNMTRGAILPPRNVPLSGPLINSLIKSPPVFAEYRVLNVMCYEHENEKWSLVFRPRLSLRCPDDLDRLGKEAEGICFSGLDGFQKYKTAYWVTMLYNTSLLLPPQASRCTAQCWPWRHLPPSCKTWSPQWPPPTILV